MQECRNAEVRGAQARGFRCAFTHVDAAPQLTEWPSALLPSAFLHSCILAFLHCCILS